MGSHFEDHHCSSFGSGGSIGRNGLRRVSRRLTLIVVHCTATLANVDFTNADLSPDRNGNGIVEQAEWLKQCPCFEVATDEWCS